MDAVSLRADGQLGPSSAPLKEAAWSGLPAAGRCSAALLLGALWFGSGVVAALSPLVVALWWRADTRTEAALIGGAYQLGATWALGNAAAAYMDVSRLESAAALLGAALLVGLGWGACWLRCAATQPAWRVGVATVVWLVVTVSPIGLGAVMVAHPLTAAGWWLPGTGWAGLLVVYAALVACAWRRGLIAVVGMSLASICVWLAAPPATMALNVTAVQTLSAPSKGAGDLVGQYDVALEAMRAARRARGAVVVLPEAAGGLWTETMRELWQPLASELADQGRVVLVGASVERADARLDNVVVTIGAGGEQRMRQRIPVPLAMWRPWSETGFAAHPWDRGVLELGGRRLAVLVCWEGALVLPALLSALHEPEAFVLLANHWWVGELGRPTMLGAKSWGALFGVPVVIARNAQGGQDA